MTTGAEQRTTRTRWPTWIDRQPVQTATAVSFFVAGALVLALGVVQVLVASIGATPVTALHQVVLGTALITMAGLAASRPGPDRLHVAVYRAVWVALTVPVLASSYAVLVR